MGNMHSASSVHNSGLWKHELMLYNDQDDKLLQNKHHESYHHLTVETHGHVGLEIFGIVLISKNKLKHLKFNCIFCPSLFKSMEQLLYED